METTGFSPSDKVQGCPGPKTRNRERMGTLQALYEERGRKVSPFVDFVQKAVSSICELWRKTPLYQISREYNLMLMSQESLSDRGSYNFSHKQLFLELTKGRNNAEFYGLRDGIKHLRTMEETAVKGLTEPGRRAIAKDMHKQYMALVPGQDPPQDMWIDLSSLPGGHSMKGRIVCQKDGSYLFQMSNTGAGCGENKDLHKVGKDTGGKPYCQTVVEWKFDNPNVITQEFFSDILRATLLGEAPAGRSITPTSGSGGYGEEMAPIMAVYAAVRKPFENNGIAPVDHPYQKGDRYWSREQQGPSCTPNSFWALARVILTKGQYSEVRIDVRLHNLQRNYQKLVSGEDRSKYTKMKVYEQVRNLIKKYQKVTGGVPKIFWNIQADIFARGVEVGRAHVKLRNSAPFDFSDPSVKEVPLRQPAFTIKPGALEADVTLEEIPKTVAIERDSAGKPTGLATLAYLFYEAILNDDTTEIDKGLHALTDFLKTCKKPSDCKVDPDQIYEMIQLFMMLSDKLQTIDFTIETRSKQLALSNVAQTLYTAYFDAKKSVGQGKLNVDDETIDLGKRVRQQMKGAVEFYRAVGTGRYKSEDSTALEKESKPVRPWAFEPGWIAVHWQEELTIQAPARKTVDVEALEHVMPTPLPMRQYLFSGKAEEEVLPVNVTNVFVGNKRQIPTVDLVQEDGRLTAQGVTGKAYMLYYHLARGDDQKVKEAVDDLVNHLQKKGSTVDDTEALARVASFLHQYSKAMITADRSAESLLVQHSVTRLSNYLLRLAKADQKTIKDSDEYLVHYNAVRPLLFVKDTNLRAIFKKADTL